MRASPHPVPSWVFDYGSSERQGHCRTQPHFVRKAACALPQWVPRHHTSRRTGRTPVFLRVPIVPLWSWQVGGATAGCVHVGSMSSLCLYCSAECRRQFRSWTRRKSDVDLTHSLVVCSTHHESALTWFARKNTMRLAEVLLNRCNDEGIDLETRRGQTALTIACREGHYAMVRLLLERGANPNYETTRGLYVIRCCQLFAEMRV